MSNTANRITFLVALIVLFMSSVALAETTATLETNYGKVTIKLYDKKAPKSVANFISYADEGFYEGTVFHRVIPNFMIQGGGFERGMVKKPTNPPITNEAQAFIPNKRGTIAMARTNDPHSATSQFFINTVNNNFLNKSGSQAGYAVFGEVIQGMDVVDAIAKVKTGRRGPYSDVPLEDVIIERVVVSSEKPANESKDQQ